MKLRALVCCATLAVAMMPIAAFAADTSPQHLQDELANGQAQWNLAQQQATDLDAEGQRSAANERMIAILKSEAFRSTQLSLSSNALAMEQIAAALANAARADGDVNARNELGIAQIKAAGLISIADANLANAMAIGRVDEIANAKAQSNILHQLADFISGTLAERNISNAKQIGQLRADIIHTPALAQEANGLAMGANSLLAADAALNAGTLNAFSTVTTIHSKASSVLAHAAASLKNAQAMAAAQ